VSFTLLGRFALLGVMKRPILAAATIIMASTAMAQAPAAPASGPSTSVPESAIPGSAAPTTGGLPPPNIKSDADLQAALAELDRSGATVVAQVGPHTVTWGDIADTIRGMPPIVGNLPFPALYRRVALQLIEQEALALRGEGAGLEKDPVVRRRMQNAAQQAMATEVLRRSLAPHLTDKALHDIYDALVAGKPGPEEVQTRLIMVDSQEQATTLITRLQNGGDFAALARDFSKDGTASNGGELGYVRLDMLSPEIGAVVFALAPGQITAYPVRSVNSWFIIQVEARRQRPAPSFEAARDALEQDVIHTGAPQLMTEAVKAAHVTYYGLTGKDAAPKTP
jgi:peptidyl-prolyl cis-trans isomerase C